MTRLEIATLACKILALYLFAEVVIVGSSVIFMLILTIGGLFSHSARGWDDLLGAAVMGIPTAATALAALFLWIRAEALAARMVSDDALPVTATDLSADTVMAVAFTAIGVFTLIPVLRDLAGIVFRAVSGPYPFSESWRSASWHAHFWSCLLGLALSLCLMLTPRGVVKAVKWAREAAKKPDG